MARFQILMFAAARDHADADVIELEIESPATAATILQQIGVRVPAIATLLPSCRLAVNRAFVTAETVVDADAEVALIPPVSGG